MTLAIIMIGVIAAAIWNLERKFLARVSVVVMAAGGLAGALLASC